MQILEAGVRSASKGSRLFSRSVKMASPSELVVSIWSPHGLRPAVPVPATSRYLDFLCNKPASSLVTPELQQQVKHYGHVSLHIEDFGHVSWLPDLNSSSSGVLASPASVAELGLPDMVFKFEEGLNVVKMRDAMRRVFIENFLVHDHIPAVDIEAHLNLDNLPKLPNTLFPNDELARKWLMNAGFSLAQYLLHEVGFEKMTELTANYFPVLNATLMRKVMEDNDPAAVYQFSIARRSQLEMGFIVYNRGRLYEIVGRELCQGYKFRSSKPVYVALEIDIATFRQVPNGKEAIFNIGNEKFFCDYELPVFCPMELKSPQPSIRLHAVGAG